MVISLLLQGVFVSTATIIPDVTVTARNTHSYVYYIVILFNGINTRALIYEIYS